MEFKNTFVLCRCSVLFSLLHISLLIRTKTIKKVKSRIIDPLHIYVNPNIAVELEHISIHRCNI